VTVTTQASSVLPPGGGGPDGGWWWLLFAALGCGAFGLARWCLRPRRRLRPALARTLLWTALGGATLLVSACGGGGAATPPPPPLQTTPGTPVGTYTVTVAGASGGLSHAIPLTLTVQ
jgi:hypothetical protein